MITLRNIKRTEQTIEADFYPEDSKEAGHMVFDLLTGEVRKCSVPEEYRGLTYASHAKRALKDLAKEKTLEETYTIFWY